MKVFRKISKFFAAALLMAVSALTSFSPAMADDIPDYRLQISPVSISLDLVPGKTEVGDFKVQNTGNKPFRFKVGVTPYSVVDEQYSPDYDTEGIYNDIVEWVTLSQTEGEVQPNEEVEIDFSIKVPKDAPGGGQYAMLYAEIVNDEDTGSIGAGITAQRRVGLILYSNVDGVTRKTGQIVENKIPSILFNPPVIAESLVNNTGNTHATARYILQVYPLFGNEEIYTNEEHPDTRTVLPETQRFNTVTWAGAPHLGIFRVKQTVYMFDEASVTEKIVFLCPIWFLFIILLIIFCAIFWVFTRVRARKQH